MTKKKVEQKATPIKRVAKVAAQTQTCGKCNEAKALSEFYKDKSRKSGYKGTCKVCEVKSRGRDKQDSNRELTRLANVNAIKRLIKAHDSEFQHYVSRERLALGIAIKEVHWVNAGQPTSEYAS